MKRTGYFVYSTNRSGWNYKVNVSKGTCFTNPEEAEAYLHKMEWETKDDSHTFWFMNEITIQDNSELIPRGE